MAETFNEEYERIHEQGKRWNANRAKAEEEGLKKFRALSDLWRTEREQKNISSNFPVISSVCDLHGNLATCGRDGIMRCAYCGEKC